MMRRKSMNIQAVIFDMDGVIIDSEPMHTEVFNSMTDEMGFRLSVEVQNTFIGRSPTSLWEYCREHHNVDEESFTLVLEQAARYRRMLSNLPCVDPMVGLPDFLDHLQDLGIPMGVASSNQRITVEHVLEVLELRERMHAVVTADDVKHVKPEPDIFLKAAKLLDIAPENCLVIEDATNGILAGKAANMTVVALNNPNSGDQDHSRADRVIQCFDELRLPFRI
ncbi:MAG: HAD family phosphatase [Chlorobiales bacterium]|nr:HAD family phosphatase [Chlorobiales bacterium]